MKKLIYIIITILLALTLTTELKGSDYGRTTETGIELIKYFEGFRNKAYLCPAGILTIGYGHTGKDIKEGMIITEKEAEIYLIRDLLRFERYINRAILRELKWHEFDALSSFTYNLGYRIKGRLREMINRGNTEGAVYIIKLYNKAKIKGKYVILAGLVKRREAEGFLYATGNKEELLKRYLR